jgi:hypothetical protein
MFGAQDDRGAGVSNSFVSYLQGYPLASTSGPVSGFHASRWGTRYPRQGPTVTVTLSPLIFASESGISEHHSTGTDGEGVVMVAGLMTTTILLMLMVVVVGGCCGGLQR